jgi:hypothetical protein
VRTYDIEESGSQPIFTVIWSGEYVQESRSEIRHRQDIKSRRPYAQTLEYCVRKEHPTVGVEYGQTDLQEEEACNFYGPVCQDISEWY